MTARCVFFHVYNRAGDRATVILTPSWLGRLLGAPSQSVDLTLMTSGWCAVATGRPVLDLRHGELILDALDFREVGSPARWALTSGAEAVAP